MSLARLAVKRPVTTAMFFIAVTLLGLFSLDRLAIDLLPEIAFPSVNVFTTYSGVAPEEIESLITVPIEQAVSTISGVTSIESVSQLGSSRVTLRFNWGTDLDAAMNDVRANLERIRNRLPEDADPPRVLRFDPSQFPIMTLGLSGDMDTAELRRLAEDEIRYYLERLDGVAAVDIQGGQRREIRVELDPLRLQAHGLTLDQVVQALQAENLNSPAGRLRVGEAQFTLRTLGEFREMDELRSVVVATRNGVQTRLEDIADIRAGTEEEGTIVRVDGQPGVVLTIQKQSGANTVQVADAVYRTVEELRRRYSGISLRPLNDTSVYIRLAVRNVIESGLYGGLLAALVLLVFLRSVRSTVVVLLAIPVSIIASFILIERAGMTLNSISLGGLALGIGMLVDNSIVVLENIYRHHSEGKDPETAAVVGTGEMASAIVASTLTTLAVFLPLMFVTGMTGILFRQLSLMVAFTLTCSLVVALTLVPVLSARLLRAGEGTGNGWAARISQRLEAFFDRQDRAYSSLVERAMRRPGLVTGVSVLLLAGSLALIPFLGSDFLPEGDAGELSISLRLPTGTRLELTDAVVRQVEELVREKVPELQALDARAGGGGGRATYLGTVNLTLVPRSQRTRSTDEIAAMLREELALIPGVTANVRTGGGFAARLARGNLSTASGGGRISINVQGFDREALEEAARAIQAAIAQVPGVINAEISRDEEQPEFVIRIDRERAADLGLSTRQISSAVQAAIQGRAATTLRVNGEEQTVRVVMAGADAISPAEVESLPIPLSGGGYVLLRSVARLETQESPAAVARLNQQRTVTVTASPEGRDLGSTVADIRAMVNALDLPQGVTVHYGGEYEEQQRAFRELLAVFILAVSLVYVVMAAQFESLLDPLIIMFSVPFALVGVILTLLLTGTPLNTQAFMGLIMLGGIVVNNAIVLVTYINLLREQGMPLDEAVVRAARTRLRPILMTTGTTVLALLPLGLALGEGSEMQMPLARTVIGGLVVSTGVTLVLIPTIYRWVSLVRDKRLRAGAGKKAGAGKSAGAPGKPSLSATMILLAFVGAGVAAGTAEAQGAGEAAFLRPITFEEVLERALAVHPDVRDAKAAWEAAESKLREYEAGYRPRLAVEGRVQRIGDLEGSDRGPRDGAVVSVTARQVLATGPSLGRIDTERELAKLEAEEARLAWEDRRQSVAVSALAAYVELLKAQSGLTLAHESLRRAEETAREVQWRFDHGMASDVELEEARLEVRRAQLALEQAQHRLRMARAGLSQQMDADLFVPWEAQPLPVGGGLASGDARGHAERGMALAGAESRSGPQPQGREEERNRVRDEAVAAALQNRFDVVAARFDLRRAQLRAEGRVSERAPVWDVAASVSGERARATLGWNSDQRDTALTLRGDLLQDGERFPDMGSEDPEWRVTVTLTWPLYDGGVEKEKALQEELEIQRQRDNVRRREREARVAIEDAEFARDHAREQVVLAAAALRNARARAEQVEQRVILGADTPLDLLRAQLNALQAEQALHEAEWDAVLAEARYRRALGQPVWIFD